MFLKEVVCIALAYTLGCFASGYYLVRWQTGQDLRQVGSGATGGRNASRVLGKKGFILTAIGDIAKGLLAVAIALWLQVEPWAVAGSLIAVLAGHVWPIQLGFKGGKGLSAAFGAVLVFDYRLALLGLIIAALLTLITRRATLGFMLGVASVPVIALGLAHTGLTFLALLIVVLIIFYAHRANLRDLIQPKLQKGSETSE